MKWKKKELIALKEFAEDIWSMTEMMDLLIIRQYDVGFDPDLELVLHYPIKKLNEIGKFLNLMSYKYSNGMIENIMIESNK